ncbi:MAG: deoxyribose-phosphate aldolase [bacterium]
MKVSDIAKMIDHSLLHPTVSDKDIKEGCRLALEYNVASVCVKPYAVSIAKEILYGSDVAIGTVVGFPHGNSRIEVKALEAEMALEDGAVELDMVVNIGKVISGDWDYVKKEINMLSYVTHMKGGILKVIFENDFLSKDELKIKLCKICSEAKADFVKTSTGYGFVKQGNGFYSYKGAVAGDVVLMRKNSAGDIKIKAAGGVRTLDELLKFKELGVDRVGASATKEILEEAKQCFGDGE